uniref:Uncharacterized protein n=1 Tax=Anguilla anguilla TaxID=7936 RepID=A0A0E9Q7R2_ANGAN
MLLRLPDSENNRPQSVHLKGFSPV